MPKLKHKFIVFKNDTEIFRYIPEEDDIFLINGTAAIYETLSKAKDVVTFNFLAQVKEITYKDFKS